MRIESRDLNAVSTSALREQREQWRLLKQDEVLPWQVWLLAWLAGWASAGVGA